MNAYRGPSAVVVAGLSVLAVLLLVVAPAHAQCQPLWSPVGTGVGIGTADTSSNVRTLAVFDDGTGSALYAGGLFDTMDGVTVNNLARWDGAHWSDVRGGLTGIVTSDASVEVDCLRVLDLGNGPVLLVGGHFKYAGEVEVNSIAAWDGQQWSALGSGLTPATDPFFMTIYDMIIHDDGTGPGLWVGGKFAAAGGVPAAGLAKWDGTAWSALTPALSHGTTGYGPTVGALCTVYDSFGTSLYVAGDFGKAGSVPVVNVARWDGSAWSALGSGLVYHALAGVGFPIPPVSAFVRYPASAPSVYACGVFTADAGGGTDLARWDGAGWSCPAHFQLPDGTGAGVSGLQEFDDGHGLAAYVFGYFGQVTPVGESTPVIASAIAKWDGRNFSPVGSGLTGHLFRQNRARTAAVFDDGTGEALYAGGWFENAGGIPAHGIARWGCLHGDLNCDGLINNQDITGFIDALFGDAGAYDAYLHSFPVYRPCSILNADFSGDGFVNSQDIDGFINALFGE